MKALLLAALLSPYALADTAVLFMDAESDNARTISIQVENTEQCKALYVSRLATTKSTKYGLYSLAVECFDTSGRLTFEREFRYNRSMSKDIETYNCK